MSIINGRCDSSGQLTRLNIQKLSASAASISFTNITQGRDHLKIVAQVRCDDPGMGLWCALQFNGDVAANYDELRGYFQPVNFVASAFNAAQNWIPICRVPGAGSAANWYQSFVSDIPNYRDTSFQRTVRSNFGVDLGNLAAINALRGSRGGSWRSSAAINRIDVIMLGVNFIAGSKFELWAY